MDKQTESGEFLSADHHSVVKTLLRSGTLSHALHLALVFVLVQLYNFSGIKTVSQTHSFSLLTVCLFSLSETRNILGSKHSHKEMKGFGKNAKCNILFFKQAWVSVLCLSFSMWRKKYIYHKWMCNFCLSRFITWKSTHQNIKQTSQREPTAQRKKTQNWNTETWGWGSKTSRWFTVFLNTLISLSGSNFNIWCCNVSFFFS